MIIKLFGTCRHCGPPAGFLKQIHPGCQKVHTRGWNEIVQLAAQAAGSPTLSETALRRTLRGIAANSCHDDTSILQAIEQGFAQSVTISQADGIITQQEEQTLRAFRDQLALQEDTADPSAIGDLDKAVKSRLQRQAQGTATDPNPNDDQLDELERAIQSIPASEQKPLLINAWETAVEGATLDGILSLDEENALHEYLDRFGLTSGDVNANGAHTSTVQAAVIRDVTHGIIPQHQNIQGGRIPFNLMKSEQLVSTIQGVDYLETVVRRERRGSSQGVSIRVAKGLYYSPRQFRSRAVEWEKTVKVDTGLLGLTTKHLYFSGSRKKFRVRYDRIVSFDPYSDGLGIMRDAQTAKPQTFITGDGWFVYNLAVNLAQI